MNTALIPTPTPQTIARAADAAERLQSPGRIKLDGAGIHVVARKLDTYMHDRQETVWTMRQILEAVASGNTEVSVWWIDQNDKMETVGYEKFVNLVDNFSGIFA